MSRRTAVYDDDDDVTACLYNLLFRQEWKLALDRCQSHPKDAQYVKDKTGYTPLHVVCSVGSAPYWIVEAVLLAYPEASNAQDYKTGNTPLHLQARNSQRTVQKVALLVQHGEILQNNLGKTPLHFACFSNSMLPVLQVLIKKKPELVHIRDYEARAPVTTLWNSYIQTIPGHLAVASVLEGDMNFSRDHEYPDHFERFYTKVRYLMSDVQTTTQEEGNEAISLQRNSDCNLGHAMLKNNCPFDLFKIVIKREPNLANVIDSSGNSLLHLIVQNRPFWNKDLECISFLLEAFPDAAKQCNNSGQAPLHLAIETNISWIDGLRKVMLAAPSVLEVPDAKTKLLPFMLAASMSDKAFTLESTFELLSARPDIILQSLL